MRTVPAPKRERKNDFEIWRDAFERRVMKDTELLPQYKVVLLALAKFLNRKTRKAFPKQRVLGEMCGVTRYVANRALAAGVARGHLSKKLSRRLGKKPLLTYAPAVHRDEGVHGPCTPSVHALCTHEPLKEPLSKKIPPSAAAVANAPAEGEIEVVRGESSTPRIPLSGLVERDIQRVIVARYGYGARADVMEIVQECRSAGISIEGLDLWHMAQAGHLRQHRSHFWIDEACCEAA